MSRRQSKGMTDKEIDYALNKLIINCERESKEAVKRAGALYAGRLRQNTPVSLNKSHKEHARDVIDITNVKSDRSRPYLEVGYVVNGDTGWYIHFPDGGTKVRGRVGQPPQHFIEKTIIETTKPIKALYRNAIKKGFDKL